MPLYSSSVFDLLSSAIRGGVEPEKLFDIYIPGFRSTRSLFLEWFRIDITKLMTLGFFFVLYLEVGRGILAQAYEHFLGYLTSSISIPANDRLNGEVLTWMSAHIAKQGTRFLSVQSDPVRGVRSPYGRDYVSKSDRESLLNALRSSNGYDKRKQPLSYFPVIGKQYFFFNRRPFIFDLRPDRYSNAVGDFAPPPSGEEPIILRCLGRDPAPLKLFLDHCRAYCLKSKESMTTVYACGAKTYRGPEWREASVRPIRPIQTVDMDETVRNDILRDAENYLKPSTRLFYAERGIPYRRGYLFYGPPGTGKTSFSLALAGQFELDVYMLSLASRDIDEGGLSTLFSLLPQRCIVLLEDIDSAGIGREGESSDDDIQAAALGLRNQKDKQPISLSGLLNTIDGAASQEGRILIMTSNTPETLDEALIRHGRIDKQVHFGQISSTDARGLFMRIFTVGEASQAVSSAEPKSEKSQPIHGPAELEQPIANTLPHDALEKLAEEFAAKIPEKRFSPAEIQGFLLDHRDDAAGAVREIEAWVLDTTLKSKLKKKTKIDNSFESQGAAGTIPPRPHSR